MSGEELIESFWEGKTWEGISLDEQSFFHLQADQR